MKKSTFKCPSCDMRTKVTTTKKFEIRGTIMPLRYHTCPNCGKTYTILWLEDQPTLLWIAHKRPSVADKMKEVLS